MVAKPAQGVRDAGGLGVRDGRVGRLAASDRDEQPRAERVGGASGVEDDIEDDPSGIDAGAPAASHVPDIVAEHLQGDIRMTKGLVGQPPQVVGL
ncbi:MAG: hypothetical protein ACRDL0_07640, partial [Thermoleophilaceae bacterium]